MPAIPPPTRFQTPFRPQSKELRLFARLFIKGDPTPSQQEVDQLGQALYQGDPLADAWVLYIMKHPKARPLLDQALSQGIHSISNPPKPLKALFEQVDTRPSWVDDQKLILANRTIRRSGVLAEWILTNLSLMGGYQSSGPTKPLVFTGRLNYSAARRLSETQRFWWDVTEINGLARYHAGFHATIKVRIMHAQARQMILRSDAWKMEDWGMPINQADLIGTNLLFSISFIMGAHVMGLRFNNKERESVLHLWRYIGYLMGIDANDLPTTFQQGVRLSYLMGATQPEPDQDSYDLAQALLQTPLEFASSPLEKRLASIEIQFRAGMSRFFIGKANSDTLGLPDTLWKYQAFALFPFFRSLEWIRMICPGGTQLATRIGGVLQKRIVQKTTQGRLNRYESVPSVAYPQTSQH